MLTLMEWWSALIPGWLALILSGVALILLGFGIYISGVIYRKEATNLAPLTLAALGGGFLYGGLLLVKRHEGSSPVL